MFEIVWESFAPKFSYLRYDWWVCFKFIFELNFFFFVKKNVFCLVVNCLLDSENVWKRLLKRFKCFKWFQSEVSLNAIKNSFFFFKFKLIQQMEWNERRKYYYQQNNELLTKMERKTEEELLSCYSPFYFVTFMAIVNFYICEADQPESTFIRRINILRRIGNGILPFLSLISGFPVGTLRERYTDDAGTCFVSYCRYLFL